MHARAHPRALVLTGAAVVSVTCEIFAVCTRLTGNILWAPTNLLRALALLGTVGPWLALTVSITVRHRAAQRA